MPKGFTAAGTAAGIKKNGEKDLGLIYCEKPATVAGAFTRNRVTAACVELSRKRLAESGVCQAIIVNSGNANCCTGDAGMADAMAMANAAASALGIETQHVMVASTGVIGQRLPFQKVEKTVPELAASLSSDGFSDFAESIMTTDTHPKVVTRQGEINGAAFTVTGVAKGAGMIRPDMATMLCFVCTDIGIGGEALQSIVAEANEKSFNRITIDGDTSTNDTLLVLASGMSDVHITTEGHKAAFGKLMEEVLVTLAKMIVKDGEGATKLVQISVINARSDEDAKKIADTVANSNLVKTAFFGEDANWGRIVAAMGRSGVDFAFDRVDICFNEVRLVQNGLYAGPDAEKAASGVLKLPEFTIILDMKSGIGEAVVWTCDFSLDYVRINADYRS